MKASARNLISGAAKSVNVGMAAAEEVVEAAPGWRWSR